MRNTKLLLAAFTLGTALVGCMADGSEPGDSDDATPAVTHGGDSDGAADPGPANPSATHLALDDSSDTDAHGVRRETSGSWAGCTIFASISQGSRNGFGEISCGSAKGSLEVETCLMQLVTGGWQTIDFTCADYTNPADHTYLWTTSYQVPYWTSGRYYATQVWARVNGGGWGYLTSESMKGP